MPDDQRTATIRTAMQRLGGAERSAPLQRGPNTEAFRYRQRSGSFTELHFHAVATTNGTGHMVHPGAIEHTDRHGGNYRMESREAASDNEINGIRWSHTP